MVCAVIHARAVPFPCVAATDFERDVVYRFLLKYSSRDEVELLGSGNGGIVEIRNNISKYDETSPLYGFLRYRRRNVIIKYLPDGCSRLVQGLFVSVVHRTLPFRSPCGCLLDTMASC